MKKLIYMVLILYVSFIVVGCFNYRDANKLFFTLGAILDVEDKNNIVLYSENFKAYRGEGEMSQSEIRVVFKGVGKTIYDAFSQILQTASSEIDYTQVKALIFTERAAKYGLENFVDELDREQKLTLREFLFIYKQPPESLLNLKLKDEQFIGLFLDNMMVNQGKFANVVRLRFDEFHNRRLIGSRINVIPILNKIKQGSDERLSVNGAAIIKNDKLVDNLSSEEVIPYNIFFNDANEGYITFPHPQNDDKYVSYRIMKSKAKVHLSYDGKNVFVKQNIKNNLILGETQGPLDFANDKVRAKMANDAENIIEKQSRDLFYKFKDRDIDIYNIQKIFEEKYPQEKIKDVLAITEFEANCKVKIEGSNDTTNFR